MGTEDIGGRELSVIVPCRNEERTIGECLRTLVNGEFPQSRLEVVVVDGESIDGTVTEVERVRREFPAARITVVNNPMGTTARAFNLGLANSTAPVIALASAHSYYPPEYLRLLVEGLETTGADCVGGTVVAEPPGNGAIAAAIAAAIAHPFGVGNSAMRTTQPREPVETDTVAFGCWRRPTLESLGGFDERVTRSQDFALMDQLRRRGGRIMMIPGVWARYVARGTMSAVIRHNLSNGFWVTYPALASRVRFAARHHVPLAFVATLALGLVPWRPLRLVALIALATYVVVLLTAAADVYRRRRAPAVAVATLIVFPTIHIAYGLGSIAGLGAGVWTRLSARSKRHSAASTEVPTSP